ncbi:MAG: DUF4440 domain-containing protein [Acidobacteriota bacterium]
MIGTAFSAEAGERLKQLEEALLSDVARKNPGELDILLADDFREFGASGRTYSKTEIIHELLIAQPARMHLEDFHAHPLTGEAALVTYRVVREIQGSAPIASLRSSIWIWRNERWQILFHQSTWIHKE